MEGGCKAVIQAQGRPRRHAGLFASALLWTGYCQPILAQRAESPRLREPLGDELRSRSRSARPPLVSCLPSDCITQYIKALKSHYNLVMLLAYVDSTCLDWNVTWRPEKCLLLLYWVVAALFGCVWPHCNKRGEEGMQLLGRIPRTHCQF